MSTAPTVRDRRIMDRANAQARRDRIISRLLAPAMHRNRFLRAIADLRHASATAADMRARDNLIA